MPIPPSDPLAPVLAVLAACSRLDATEVQVIFRETHVEHTFRGCHGYVVTGELIGDPYRLVRDRARMQNGRAIDPLHVVRIVDLQRNVELYHSP